MSLRYHTRPQCIPPCPFHAPSKHHMRTWPKVVRESGLVERLCPHGIGHPDPDSLGWMDENGGRANRGTWGVHGCDGCCQPGARA